MINLTGQVGLASTNAGDGSQLPFRQGKTGEIVVQNLHGRYYEQVVRGNVYGASNQAAQAVSVALATTYTGLCLSNPLGNNRNLVLLSVGYALSVAPAAIASLHLIGSSSPSTDVSHTAAVTPRNMLIGNGATASAKVDSSATIPTPVYLMSLMGGFTAGALPSSPNALFDIAGQIVIAPGGFVALGALTAVTGFASMVWEEVPIPS
jgi:hypothetical protein